MFKSFVCSSLLLIVIVRLSFANIEPPETSIETFCKRYNEKSSSTNGAAVLPSKPDYIYNPDVYGWLKLHRIPATFEDALLKCHYEGTVLASPLNQKLLNAFDGMMKTNMTRSIVLGTQTVLYGDFLSIEGVRLVDMPVNWNIDRVEQGNCLILGANSTVYAVQCSRQFPYICYKQRNNDTVLNNCGTFDKEYEFDKRTGSCYKVHDDPQDWLRAHMTCVGEGGYLVVINDAVEAKVVRDCLIIQYGYNWTETAFIGIRALRRGRNWITVHGDKLDTVYHVWKDGYPKMWLPPSCGDFDPNDMKLGANECSFEAVFICEKDPKVIRFGPPEN